jgi:hypothetical protein
VRCLRPVARVAWLAAAAALVVAAATGEPADAQRGAKKKPRLESVRIETAPAGAAVYLGDKESGAAGTTPFELSLPAGEHVLILELEGHVPRFEMIVVEAGAGPQVFAYDLDPAIATLVIEAEEGTRLPPGTRVLVDGEDRGEPPLRIDVDVGPHQVQVVAPGQPPYEEWIDIEGGQEHLMAVSGETFKVTGAAPVDPPRRPRAGRTMGTLRAGAEVGFRSFAYRGARSDGLRPYDASGTLHGVIDAELHPWRLALPNRVLDRVSILAGAGYSPAITASTLQGMTVDAYWRAQHAGLRVRALDRGLALDVDVEWVHTLYTFRDEDNFLVDEVPDVDYHLVRLGLRALGRVGRVEGWLSADNRVVFRAGALERRFRPGTEVTGVAGRAGVAAWLLGRRLEARAEAHFTRYAWRFASQPGDPYDADGATDALFGIVLTLGGSY